MGSLASRNANSGLVVFGSCLSFLRDILVLKVFFEILVAVHEVGGVKPLGADVDFASLVEILLHALQTNRDDTDMLALNCSNHSMMANAQDC